MVSSIQFLVKVMFICAGMWSCRADQLCDPMKYIDQGTLDEIIWTGPAEVPPIAFEINAEETAASANETTSIIFQYDSAKKMIARYEINPQGERALAIWNFNTGQRVVINKNQDYVSFDQQCSVDTISNTSDVPMLFKRGLQAPFQDRFTMPTVAEILLMRHQWMEEPPVRIRGMNALTWKSCQVNTLDWVEKKKFATLQYYWSNPRNWNMPFENRQVPLKLVSTMDLDTNGNRETYTYTLSFFRPFTKEFGSLFKIPAGAFCDGILDSELRLPFPNAFAFKSEILATNKKKVVFMDAWFNRAIKMSRFDYKPTDFDGAIQKQLFGNTPLREIHDFNTGRIYFIDSLKGSCSIYTFNDYDFSLPHFADKDPTNKTFIVMNSPQAFLGLPAGKIPGYYGLSNIRGMVSDTWTLTESNKNDKSTTTWYFTEKPWKIDPGTEDAANTKLSDLVAMDIFTDGGGIIANERYNFYEVDLNPNDFEMYDVGICYTDKERIKYTIIFPGTLSIIISGKLNLFKASLYESISTAARIDQMRVSGMQVDFMGDKIRVEFTILGVSAKAPLNNVENPRTEISLKEADTNLRAMVKAGKFSVIIVTSQLIEIQLTAREIVQNEVYQDVPVSTVVYEKQPGISGGVIAVIAIACFVVGALLGLLVMVVKTRITS